MGRLLRAATGWVLPAALSVLLVALVATCVVLWRDRDRAPEASATIRPADLGVPGADRASTALAAVNTARRAARTYFTIDHRTVRADMDRMRALATEAFRNEYDATADRAARRIRDRKLVLTASLPDNGAATEYLTGRRAQILVAVDVTTRRRAGGRGDTDATGITTAYRTRISLRNVDEQWRVSGVDEVEADRG